MRALFITILFLFVALAYNLRELKDVKKELYNTKKLSKTLEKDKKYWEEAFRESGIYWTEIYEHVHNKLPKHCQKIMIEEYVSKVKESL